MFSQPLRAPEPLQFLAACVLAAACCEDVAASTLPRINVINDSTMGMSAGTSDVLILGDQKASTGESVPESILSLNQNITCADVRGRPALCTSIFKDVTLGLHEPGLIASAMSDILTLTVTDGAVVGTGKVTVSYESDPVVLEKSLAVPPGTPVIDEKEDTVQDLTGTLQTLATGGKIPEPSSWTLVFVGLAGGFLYRRTRRQPRLPILSIVESAVDMRPGAAEPSEK